ncbi:MAG: RES domain-containing protein [Sphingobacteriales bacterium]|nr:MAG: RES domain-containing protein [Sphingobacteriales bacterium]
MEVFRLCRQPFSTSLSGKGAALYGARWNPVGMELIYTASNRSLAMAEVAVHLTLATLPTDYCMMTIAVPDDLAIEHILPADLPPNWNRFPHGPETQKLGEAFLLSGKAPVLQVPSAVVQGDFNILINPQHGAFSCIQIVSVEPFPFDQRIFKG